MKYKKGLIKKELSDIRIHAWYRQRFDACPHFMAFIGEAHTSTVNHSKYPYGQRTAYAGFSNNRADWYHNLEELKKTAQIIIKKSKKDKFFCDKLIQEFKPWEEKFYQECAKLHNLDLQKLDLEEIPRLYSKFAQIYLKKLQGSSLIDGFALSTDTILAQDIQDYLKTKNKRDKFVEYFSVLTAPTFLSFLQLEEVALLEKVLEAKSKPEKKQGLIKQHQDNYFWIQNNYVKDNILGLDFFEHRFNDFKKVDCQRELNNIREIPAKNQKLKDALIDEIDLPEQLQTLMYITDKFNAWQDERKKGTFFATHYVSQLLDSIAKKTKYTLEQLKYTVPSEIKEIVSEIIGSGELDKRRKHCMVMWVGDEYEIITNTSLIKTLDEIGTGKNIQTTELRGLTASRGITKGRVKIVLGADEVSKIEDGDVLVAVMTRPDYLIGMRKAAAFITDEGGITCHAAIVAREMKKPCIIGTKISTKVLKDGDLVEVDANKGLIRKITRF